MEICNLNDGTISIKVKARELANIYNRADTTFICVAIMNAGIAKKHKRSLNWALYNSRYNFISSDFLDQVSKVLPFIKSTGDKNMSLGSAVDDFGFNTLIHFKKMLLPGVSFEDYDFEIRAGLIAYLEKFHPELEFTVVVSRDSTR